MYAHASIEMCHDAITIFHIPIRRDGELPQGNHFMQQL